MFYLSFVLLSTFIISTVIYIYSLLDPTMDRPQQDRVRGLMKRVNKKKKQDHHQIQTKDDKEGTETNKLNEKEKSNEEKEEKEDLKVTIICNKKPIVEAVEAEERVEVVKWRRMREIFSCLTMKKKSAVNIPLGEWSGPANCTINKNVKLKSSLRVSRHSGELLEEEVRPQSDPF